MSIRRFWYKVIQPKDIIISGDSCGANLALALCLRLKAQPDPCQSGLILMSPYLDLNLNSGIIAWINKKHDALLSVEALQTGINHYLKMVYKRMIRVFLSI